MAIVSKIHNVSYLSDIKVDLNSADLVAEMDGSFSAPLAFVPAGAVVVRVSVKTLSKATSVTELKVNSGFNAEKNLFVNDVDVVTTPATSAVIYKTLTDGVVTLNVAAKKEAVVEGFVEYYLPATIKTEI